MFRNNGKADSHFDLLANGTRIYFHLGFHFRLTFCFCFCSFNVNFIFKNEPFDSSRRKYPIGKITVMNKRERMERFLFMSFS